MSSKGRLTIGALLPGFLGGCIVILMLLQEIIDEFSYITTVFFIEFFIKAFVIVYIFIGIQSIIYSFVMEFLVLRRIQRKILVIFVSALLCLLFLSPFFILTHKVELEFLIRCSFTLFGIGVVAGFILHSMYRRQLIRVSKNN